MCCTDFERKLNGLLRDVKNGIPKQEAQKELKEVLKYALFDSERNIANEKFSLAIETREGIAW